MSVKEEIKKSAVSELTKKLIQWLLPLLSTLFLGLIPQVRDHIWPAIPKWLLLVLTVIFLSATLALLQFLSKSRRKLTEVQSAYEEISKPEEFEPDEKDKEIMQYLFQSNVDRVLSVIKSQLNFEHTEELKLHLNTMIKHGHVHTRYNYRQGRRFLEYWLTDKGRDYVVRNLLKSGSDI